MKLFVIDLGGTSIKYGVYQNQKILEHSYIKTANNVKTFLKDIGKIWQLVNKRHNFDGVAISSPGVINYAEKKIDAWSAIPYIHKKDFIKKLKSVFGELPISIENDANCGGMAEIKFGTALNKKNVVYITLGTGIGGSVFIDGKLYKGSKNKAGEFGLINFVYQLSIGDIGSIVREIKKIEIIKKLEPGSLDGRKFFDFVEKNDKFALKSCDSLFRNWATLVYNIQATLDPEMIVIGGGPTEYKYFNRKIKPYISTLQNTITQMQIDVNLKIAKFKNKANLIGAAIFFEKGIRI